jgi:hypothetical protein
LINSQEEFANDIAVLGILTWTAEDVVRLKRNCKAKVSYQYLIKRLKRVGHVTADQFKEVKFKNLEDRLFGVPF